jgi:predicted metal-dependent hydrolase
LKPILRIIRDTISMRSPAPLPDEIFLPALEEHWKVRYRKTSSRTVQARSDGAGVVTVSGSIEDGWEVRRALRRWLVRHARSALVPWLNALSVQGGLNYGKVAVRGQTTRWASCSSKGNINLNYKLLFLPPEVVRYILNHELCHTLHQNHSKKFWSEVALVEPGHKTLNRFARKGMEAVPQWAKGRDY